MSYVSPYPLIPNESLTPLDSHKQNVPIEKESAPKEKRYILITGAASGIGLAFFKHFRRQSYVEIIATDIDDLPIEGAGHVFLQGNLESERFRDRLRRQIGNSPIHLVIHSAGVRGLMPLTSDDRGVASRETWQTMDAKKMVDTFSINTAATFSLIRMLVGPLIRAGTEDYPILDAEGQRPQAQSPWVFTPKIIIMTSRMGSISYNSAGGAYAYRASKAALNAIIKSFSIDIPEVTFALVHPGRVETGLVEHKEEGAMTVEESVGDMLKLMERLELEDSGRFMDRFGEDIGW